jgi:ferredoxin
MKFATLEQLRRWIDGLSQRADVIAPCDVDGHVLYRPVRSGDVVLFDYERPELSAKLCVLPPSEVLFELRERSTDVTLEEHCSERPQVALNIRPCDAHGIAVLDALFLEQDPPDATYRRRRERTTLVGLACQDMWEGCFCTSVGGGPDDGSHLDVLLHEVKDGYAVEILTDAGRALCEDLDRREGVGAPPSTERGAAPLPVIPPTGWRALFDDPIWMRHGERCLSCRICAYICPTCRCFDVVDRVVAERPGETQIERVRVWDSCTSPNYRRAAGGHNSRPTKTERLRNRFYCKFCYYPEDFGPLGCVGCGRCVISCPVDIDITEVLADVDKASQMQSAAADVG